MTGKTIPDLPAAASLTGSEPIEAVQGSTSVKTTTQAVANLAVALVPAILVESGVAKKVSLLTAGSSLGGTEEVPIVQGGATVRTTAQDIANLAPGQTPSVLVESGISKKTSAMSAAASLTGTETVPVVQSGANVKATTQAIANLAPSALPSLLVESGASAKISALSAAASLAGTETVAIVQSGATVKTTAQAIADLSAAAAPSILVESGSSEKISAMSSAGALAGTETLAIVQSGATVKVTAQNIANLYVQSQPVTQKSGTTYTFALVDTFTYIQFTNASSVTATIPTNASVAFVIGSNINFEQNDAGVVTIAAAGGVTIHSNGSVFDTNGQYAVGSITKVATNTWTLSGNLV